MPKPDHAAENPGVTRRTFLNDLTLGATVGAITANRATAADQPAADKDKLSAVGEAQLQALLARLAVPLGLHPTGDRVRRPGAGGDRERARRPRRSRRRAPAGWSRRG